MKIITLLFLAILLYSCGNSKEEQMLYDYQQENVKSMNFDLKDLDYDVQKIKKVGDITAQDSMKLIKQELAEYWEKNPDQNLVDTLTFQYVKSVLDTNIALQDTLYKVYQQSVITGIKYDNYSLEYESERKRNKAIEKMKSYQKTLLAVKELEEQYNQFEKDPTSILAVKYKANYSYNNPVLGNAKQTFEKYFYTNREQTKFIKHEDVKDK